ncbi:hypothetical protein M758_7G155800 [Ceratodon purpureus]|uniref:Uncharacterized protein n=1 Tax=Ceratodon purpureus TaxID=3225 RepID=A0A8T0HA66_CERPU|nr:hypothetical protein KC19_7G122400 [Ceratodon purpureus]KAG0611655.1 hypothetical protein M758_7G155800 [Ceratodon purpureus]
MGGGAMWRSVIRVVGSAPTTAASNAAMCRMCTTTPALKAPTSARIACNCPAEGHAPGGQANSGSKQYWDIDDWEFAGDDERDYLVFGTLPTQQEVEEATSDLQHALQIGLLTGRSTSPLASSVASTESSADVKDVSMSTSVVNVDGQDIGYLVSHPSSVDDWKEPTLFEVASTSSNVGGKSAMLEAFHQFQHNPQVQKMVVSLATDKGVWDAVLANDQIKEFRQKLRESTGLIENGSDLTVDEVSKTVSKSLKDDTNIFSHVYWNTKKAFTQFMATLQELIRGIFDTTEQTLKISDDDEDFFQHTVRSTMMLSVLVMSLVVFKRSAAHCS